MIATINCRPSVLNPYDRATFDGRGAGATATTAKRAGGGGSGRPQLPCS
jgi:hypothetical protein